MNIIWILIPIVAILCNTYLKAKKLEVEKTKLSSKTKDPVDKILLENNELKIRIENLEEIVTSLEKEQLRDLQSSQEVILLKKQIAQILQQLPNKES